MIRTNLLISGRYITVFPSLAVKIGLNEAIFLQQLHYWLYHSGKIRDGRIWIYNSASAWQAQFPFWCEKTIRRTIDSLKAQNLVITGNFNAAKFDKTCWYAIDYETFAAIETEIERTVNDENGESIQTNCPDDIDNLNTSYLDKLTTPIPYNRSHTKITNPLRVPKKAHAGDPLVSPEPCKKSKENTVPAADFVIIEEAWDAYYKFECGQDYVRNYGRDRKLLTPFMRAAGVEEVHKRVRKYFSLPVQYWGRDIKTFVAKFNMIPAAAKKVESINEPPHGALDLTKAMEGKSE